MIELNKLESHLWDAANILRGPVDAADFKTYIFPLLFFKRISDVYDEEIDTALRESEGDMMFALFPENHGFQVPEDCHWNDVRAKSANIGHALQQAMRGIEQANPDTLHGIFGDAQWTNKDRLSDALLKELIEHFSKLSLGNENCRADVLGQSYEYLIKKFAELTNKKAGEFYTPRSVVALIVSILAPKAGDTIYDPACGTGGMLLEALHYVKEHGGDEHSMLGNLYGQEKNLTTSAIARMNLFLHGAEDFYIERGDTLRQPAFYTGDGLAVFDCVIANPPFSLEKWGDDVWINDPYGRNFAGLPPAKSGDFAWVQHMIKSMAHKTGRMAVVLPHGVLFRMSKEGEIRRKLLEMDILEAVFGLGPNLFYGTGLAACILVFRESKPETHRRKVLFIDASREYKTGRAQNELLPEHIQNIHRWYEDYRDVEGVCRVATLDKIRENDFNLNIPRYVESVIEEETVTVEEAVAHLKESLRVFAGKFGLLGIFEEDCLQRPVIPRPKFLIAPEAIIDGQGRLRRVDPATEGKDLLFDLLETRMREFHLNESIRSARELRLSKFFPRPDRRRNPAARYDSIALPSNIKFNRKEPYSDSYWKPVDSPTQLVPWESIRRDFGAFVILDEESYLGVSVVCTREPLLRWKLLMHYFPTGNESVDYLTSEDNYTANWYLQEVSPRILLGKDGKLEPSWNCHTLLQAMSVMLYLDLTSENTIRKCQSRGVRTTFV